MNILLNFGRKTSIMKQCCGCNKGCKKGELERVHCCKAKLCQGCFDCPNCPNCGKPNKSMHKTVRNRGSMRELEENDIDNADDKQFGLTPFEQAIQLQDTYLIQGMCDRMLFSSDKKKAMSMAIRSGNADTISFLKKSRFPFDYHIPLDLMDEFGYLDQYQARMLLDL